MKSLVDNIGGSRRLGNRDLSNKSLRVDSNHQVENNGGLKNPLLIKCYQNNLKKKVNLDNYKVNFSFNNNSSLKN